MAELQQTKGSIRLEGIIVGFDPSNENTYREGTTGSGSPYRSISMIVKTSPNNVVYNNDIFGAVPTKKVKIFSNKNNEKKNIEIDFDDRNLVNGVYEGFPVHFTCFGFGTVGTGLEKTDTGSIKMKNYFNYDGVEHIKNSIVNDTPVWVESEFNINTYESSGEKKTNVKFNVNRIGLLKDGIDFESENFKEVASFEQEFVVLGHQADKEAKKLYVYARIIHFNKKWDDMTLVVDASKYSDLAQNIMKKTKFGDLLKVQGIVRNGTEVIEIEEAPAVNWGGETPEGQGKKVNRNKISEFQITNVTGFTGKVYKEDDFVVEQSLFDTASGSDLPFNEEENPFG